MSRASLISDPSSVDWKSAALWTGIEGSDVSGRVLTVGSAVRNLRPGQRVCAFTPMRYWQKPTKYGTYQSHTVCPENTVAVIPDNLSFEAAATLPLAALTAAVGLFRNLRVPPPREDPEPLHERTQRAGDDVRPPLLVWGASSSVGTYVVQLARLSRVHKLGFHVLGVAGSSAPLARAVGADAIFDYRGSPRGSGTDGSANHTKLMQEINEYLTTRLRGARLERAFDAVSTYDTVDAIAHIMHTSGTAPRSREEIEEERKEGTNASARQELDHHGRKTPRDTYVSGGKGIVTTVLPTDQESLQKDLESPLASPIIKRTMVGTTHAGGADFGAEWLPRLVRWASEGVIQPNKVRVVPGGLDGVIEGLRLLKSGQVRGEKLVCEYPFLQTIARASHQKLISLA